MRILFLGDMVGKTGRTAVYDKLPGLKKRLKTDFVIVIVSVVIDVVFDIVLIIIVVVVVGV